MTPEEMKSIIREMNEDSWHRRDLDNAYLSYADEIVFHRPPFPAMEGTKANRLSDEGMLAAFSETQSTIHELVVEGSTIVARWTWQAWHTGTLPNLGIPATGKLVKFSGCSVYHFKEDKIIEQWEFSDLFGLMQQLGVISFP